MRQQRWDIGARQRIARRSAQYEFSQTGVTVPAHDDHVGPRQHRSFLQSGRDAALADGQDLDGNFATMTRQMAGDMRAGLLFNVLLTQDRQHFHRIDAGE